MTLGWKMFWPQQNSLPMNSWQNEKRICSRKNILYYLILKLDYQLMQTWREKETTFFNLNHATKTWKKIGSRERPTTIWRRKSHVWNSQCRLLLAKSCQVKIAILYRVLRRDRLSPKWSDSSSALCEFLLKHLPSRINSWTWHLLTKCRSWWLPRSHRWRNRWPIFCRMAIWMFAKQTSLVLSTNTEDHFFTIGIFSSSLLQSVDMSTQQTLKLALRIGIKVSLLNYMMLELFEWRQIQRWIWSSFCRKRYLHSCILKRIAYQINVFFKKRSEDAVILFFG